MASPIHPVTLDDKRTVTERLSSLGADITQLNTVRKSISRVKGGQLANRCGGGQLVSLIMSDIIGDPVDFIASGPTVVSQDTRQEALRILDQFDPGKKQISKNVYSVLQTQRPKSTGNAKISNVIIANNAIAVDASGVEAVARGYDYIMTCDLDRDIDARRVAHQLVDWLVKAVGGKGPNCLISGGEPVVKLCQNPGLGGRNQQIIIEAIEYITKEQLSQIEDCHFVILSAGTDGEDGTTTAAGAWVDNQILKIAKSHIDAVKQHRIKNDAFSLFREFANLLETGPTGTNVCDVRVILVEREASI